MDKIGLVTITYNSEAFLRPFLNCVFKQTYSNFILYVIDNDSVDGTILTLENVKETRLKVIKNHENLGVAKANNQGIRRAILDGCDQLLIINNDVEFESSLIEKLIKIQIKDKSSLVSPKMMYYDNPNQIWYAGSWFIKEKGYLPLHRGLKELDEGQYNEIIDVEYAPTCCLLIKREVFQDIGLMDEKYFVYFDDTDFSYRVWKDGRHKILYYPHVEFYHKVGSLTKSFVKDEKKIYRGNFFLQQNIKNHIYFLKKIGGLFSYTFIAWLFLRNNIKFIVNPQIRKNISTWWLINKSYFQGLIK